MNLLFLTLAYPDDLVKQAARDSKDGLQMQINGYQRALAEGIRKNLRDGEALAQVNALPVGSFPTRYKRLYLRGFTHAGNIRELGCVNLPYLKQRQREAGAYRAVLRWAAQSPQNRTVLVYTLYLPYLRAVLRAKKRYPDLRAAVIVTDLPNERGIATWRRGLFKRLDHRMGEERAALCAGFDGFVLLTEHMAEALPVGDKPRVVVEGLLGAEAKRPPQTFPERFTVLYTGTMNRELGVDELLEAFRELPDCDLWLCGAGDMAGEAAREGRARANVSYFGFVPQERALALQAGASALINPRSPKGAYTRYSFPSKTLEYLRAGKPVLCRKLDGIPDEYDPYLRYIDGEGARGVREAVESLARLAPEELARMGERGRDYVRANKSAEKQATRMMDMLRALR